MKKIITTFFIFFLVACSENTDIISPAPLAFSENNPADTLQLQQETEQDTVYVNQTDTLYIDRISVDTQYVQQIKIDTQYIFHHDTSFIFDTTYLLQKDTILLVHRDISASDQLPSNDSLKIPEGSDTLNIVYFGNSLIMGYDSFGMSASAATQDLCTKVNQYFSSLGYVVNGVRATSKDFERRLVKSEREEILAEKLYPELDKSTDILVIVLSDNIVNDEMLDAFRDSFAELLDSAQSRMSDSAKIICVSSWYTSGTIDKAREIVEAKSKEKGVTFVDISDLYADEGNRSYLGAVIFRNDVRQYSMSYDAISEVACTLTIRFSVEGKTVSSTIIPDSYEIDYENKVVSWTGHEFIVTNPAIATHPGDLGFTRIAERVVSAISN